MPPVRKVGNISVKVTVKGDRTGAVIAAILANAKQAVDDTAVDLQTMAFQLAPVDTGALRNSIYINNGDSSDYTTRVAIAGNLRPEMQALDELDPEFVISLQGSTSGPNVYVTVIGVAAHYGLFQEEGTVFQPPQSFMRPAAESMGDELSKKMSDGIANL